jgi:hypothetical protein
MAIKLRERTESSRTKEKMNTTIKFEKRGWIGLGCRGIHDDQVEEERTDIQGQRRE